MGKILVLAEKPSVGRDIAKVIGCSQKGDGCLIGDTYIVSWAIGHLITLYEPEEYDEKYKKWKSEDLPIIPEAMKIKPVEATIKQFEIVKRLMNDANIDSLICATDSGREGELIFRYIYEMAGCQKSFQRLWISSMTDAAIKEGFAKLKPGCDYDNLYNSAKCRSEADWLVGMNASRAFTIRYNALLSVGRVQTPTLAILVAKQKEINAFVAQEYFEVNCIFNTSPPSNTEGSFKGVWIDKNTKETKIQDKKKAQEIAKKVKAKSGHVASIENEEKKQPAPLLYDLTELQRDANKKFGFSAQKTLETAQNLYEKHKMITYPRTDSRYLSNDMIPKIKSTLKKLNVPDYSDNVIYILGLSELPISKRIINEEKISDHHAIIPTDAVPKLSELPVDEKKVYDLIVKRFLSVFYPNYIFTTTRIESEVEGETFMTRGKTVIQQGWMELYGSDEKKDKDKDDEQELPKLNKADPVYLSDAQVQQKKTKAPSAYTEATLLSAMENAGRFIEDEELKEMLKDGGLGTPATRAAIIERLIQVGYIERKGKSLIPTQKGIDLIEIVPFELKSPETTGKWEKGLSSMAKGKLSPERFMGSIKNYVQYIVKQSRFRNNNIIFDPDKRKMNPEKKAQSLGKCPFCKRGDVLEHSKGFYCSYYTQGCKFTIWKNNLESFNIEIDAQMVKEILKNGRVEDIYAVHPATHEKQKAAVKLKNVLGQCQIEFLKEGQ